MRSLPQQDELQHLLKHAEIKDKRIPILFFANKVRRSAHAMCGLVGASLLRSGRGLHQVACICRWTKRAH